MLDESRRLQELQELINYKFNDESLLKKALIHRSFGNENWEYKNINNEKLELLGDAVLDLIVTEYLYKNFAVATEGELAKLKSMIVSEPVLANISSEIKLGNYLMLSKGEELTGGRERESILGDVFEALLGAIYLDSEINTVRDVALKYLIYKIEHINENEELIDYKTILQEYSQRVYKIIPVYEVINELGPDHKKSFEISVSIEEKKVMGRGVGKNKKQAEQFAAREACKNLEIKI
ncbi:MAG: ribonuclease III [Fusobacteriaceae bacterium]|nr:ribonuclease III [Fusobacteriaceae bacterium]MBP6467304.1 ribonuclease III [Fusobacteriaceae bacterium]MBP9596303.1 ribonuclease III [Fusobacteriaceae bacterium]MBU9917502.1 ribonuclease III [Fusobacteriaceae bacterium]